MLSWCGFDERLLILALLLFQNVHSLAFHEKTLKHEVLALMIGLVVCNYHIRHIRCWETSGDLPLVRQAQLCYDF